MSTSLLLRLAARWSDGIRLCITQGPASGRMMGYAYRNQAGGRGFLGRWIDRRFLNYPGWEGVRQRGNCLEQLITLAIDSSPAPVHLLDIAGGTADYVLGVLSKSKSDNVTALCIDISPESTAEGQRNVQAAGLNNVIFQHGDALDENSLLQLSPRPNLVICSGLYELLIDDEMMHQSVRIVSQMLSTGEYFILSHQIARPKSLFGKHAATMKMRSTGEIEQLLTVGGFTIERQFNAANLYAVFLARRI